MLLKFRIKDVIYIKHYLGGKTRENKILIVVRVKSHHLGVYKNLSLISNLFNLWRNKNINNYFKYFSAYTDKKH